MASATKSGAKIQNQLRFSRTPDSTLSVRRTLNTSRHTESVNSSNTETPSQRRSSRSVNSIKRNVLGNSDLEWTGPPLYNDSATTTFKLFSEAEETALVLATIRLLHVLAAAESSLRHFYDSKSTRT